MSDDTPAWLLALVRDFDPKVVPLDVTPEGTYEEATTRWGMNPVYEAVPEPIRREVERALTPWTQQHFERLRADQES